MAKGNASVREHYCGTFCVIWANQPQTVAIGSGP